MDKRGAAGAPELGMAGVPTFCLPRGVWSRLTRSFGLFRKQARCHSRQFETEVNPIELRDHGILLQFGWIYEQQQPERDYSSGRTNSKPKTRISPRTSWRRTLAVIGGVSLGTRLDEEAEGAGMVM